MHVWSNTHTSLITNQIKQGFESMTRYTLQNFWILLNEQNLNFQTLDELLEKERSVLMESQVLNRALIELVLDLIQQQEQAFQKS
jgi:hypothetical protein